MLNSLKSWARGIRRDVHALSLASRDPRVPWYAKALAMAVVAYALSPIDLIPDFIPVVGQLDELIILPLGLLLVIRLVPPEVMAEYRAIVTDESKRVSRAAAVVVVCIWIVSIAVAFWLGYRIWQRHAA